jgi:(p)ppGpp synthase/HD superfamily hydrolase
MYSPRIDLALTTMLESHGLHQRKIGRDFEATHVTSVAMIVADYGFDEDTVIAALLHDALEDTDLDPKVIRLRFGDLVLATVQDVSEPKKPRSWRDRKEAYLKQLQSTPRESALAVASADKIHNLSNMTQGLVKQGRAFVKPFTASLEEMVWYQETVLATLRETWSHVILKEHGQRNAAFLDAVAKLTDENHP